MLHRSIIDDEDAGRFNRVPSAVTQVSVVNTDKPNKYGKLRGYRILPRSSQIYLTVENSTNLINAAQ